MEWLKKQQMKLQRGKQLSIKSAGKAKFYINQRIPTTYSISENSLKRLLGHYNISYTAKKRPNEKEIPELVELKIINYHLML